MDRLIPMLAVLLTLLAGATARAEGAGPGPSAFEAGVTAQRAGRHAEAVAAFERAVAAEPDRVEAWAKLAASRSILMDYDAAIEAYTRATELEPQNAKHWNNLANAHFRKGDYDTAARIYGKAVELDPQYVLGQFHLGWTLRELNRSADSEKAFQACRKIAPHDDRDRRTQVDCLFGLGSLRHRAGDYGASASMMEQVLAVFPNHPEARYYLAMAYRQLGRLDDAEREMKRHQQNMAAQRNATSVIERPLDP